MEDFRTSISAISNATTCPWKYYVYNVERANVKVESVAKVQGILVHSLIEDFYAANMDDKAHTRKSQEAWFKDRLDTVWTTKFNARSLDLIREYIQEYREAVEDTTKYQRDVLGKACKAPTWTAYWRRTYATHFEALEKDKFAECYERFFHIKWASTLLEVYTHIDRCLINFITLNRRMPIPQALHIEYKPEKNTTRFGVNFNGRLDRVAVMPDGAIEVHDFKTGRKDWSAQDVANSDQLMAYAVMVEQAFGALPAKVGIMDLYNARVIERRLCDNDLSRFHKRMEGNLRYTRSLDLEIREQGIEEAIKTRPIPLGMGSKLGCPCDLIYEDPESQWRCPFYDASITTSEE